ncbi:hypothetical protein LXL04_023453 [Taraxacum kok-saghyz]
MSNSGNGLGCYLPAVALLHSRRARLSSLGSNGTMREDAMAGGLVRNKEEGVAGDELRPE